MDEGELAEGIFTTNSKAMKLEIAELVSIIKEINAVLSSMIKKYFLKLSYKIQESKSKFLKRRIKCDPDR